MGIAVSGDSASTSLKSAVQVTQQQFRGAAGNENTFDQNPSSSQFNRVLGQLRDFSYTCVSRRRLILKLDRGLRACVRWTPVDDTYLFNDGLEFGNAILEGSLVFHIWIRLVNLLGAESGV